LDVPEVSGGRLLSLSINGELEAGWQFDPISIVNRSGDELVKECSVDVLLEAGLLSRQRGFEVPIYRIIDRRLQYLLASIGVSTSAKLGSQRTTRGGATS
jgi:hypothetical protein